LIDTVYLKSIVATITLQSLNFNLGVFDVPFRTTTSCTIELKVDSLVFSGRK